MKLYNDLAVYISKYHVDSSLLKSSVAHRESSSDISFSPHPELLKMQHKKQWTCAEEFNLLVCIANKGSRN